MYSCQKMNKNRLRVISNSSEHSYRSLFHCYVDDLEKKLRSSLVIAWKKSCTSWIVETLIWLVVGPPLWKIWKSSGMIRTPIYGKIKNVPNHQLDYYGSFPHSLRLAWVSHLPSGKIKNGNQTTNQVTCGWLEGTPILGGGFRSQRLCISASRQQDSVIKQTAMGPWSKNKLQIASGQQRRCHRNIKVT